MWCPESPTPGGAWHSPNRLLASANNTPAPLMIEPHQTRSIHRFLLFTPSYPGESHPESGEPCQLQIKARSTNA